VNTAAAVTFDQVIVLGDVDRGVLPDASNFVSRPADAVGGAGRLPVDVTLRWAREQFPRGRLLVLTDRDLLIPEVESLFGFSDWRRQVAIVSTVRLASPDAAQWRHRVANAIAHEAGHLDGLQHCPHVCLMRPASGAIELDTRPDTACGRCPRRTSVITKTVVALAAGLLLIAVISRVFEHRPPPRVAPALPAAIASALSELPRDTDEVFSRPVTVVGRASVSRDAAPVLLTPGVLPPGIDAGLLASFATSITSATFRTPAAEPIAYVHVIDTQGPPSALSAALGCPAATGTSAYNSCRVERAGIEAHVLTPRIGARVVLVFSPHASGRDLAARLAAGVGTSTGVWRERDMAAIIGGLPAALPDGYALETLIASNIHRIPEAVDQITAAILGDDMTGGAAHLERVLPLAIESATYRNSAGRSATIVVGDYGSIATAWLTFRSIRGTLEPWIIGETVIGGGAASRLQDGRRHGVIFRRGQVVIAAYADDDSSGHVTNALAGALQF
jgi:hypothetical protein